MIGQDKITWQAFVEQQITGVGRPSSSRLVCACHACLTACLADCLPGLPRYLPYCQGT